MITSNWTVYAFGGALIAFILLFGFILPHSITGHDKSTRDNIHFFRAIAFLVFFIGLYFLLSPLWQKIALLFLTLIVYFFILYFLWQRHKAGTILLKLEFSLDEKMHLWIMSGLLLWVIPTNLYDIFGKNSIWTIQSWNELSKLEMHSFIALFLYLAMVVLYLFKVLYKKELSKTGIFNLPFALSWDKVTTYRWQLIKPTQPDWYLEIQRPKPQLIPIRIVVTAAQKAAVDAILQEYSAGKDISDKN